MRILKLRTRSKGNESWLVNDEILTENRWPEVWIAIPLHTMNRIVICEFVTIHWEVHTALLQILRICKHKTELKHWNKEGKPRAFAKNNSKSILSGEWDRTGKTIQKIASDSSPHKRSPETTNKMPKLNFAKQQRKL